MHDLTLVYTVVIAAVVAVLSAVILYVIAKKFHIEEDPRVDEVTAALPGVNCGGCGYAGCRNFAEACVKADTMDKLFCPVGGNNTMAEVARILGKDVKAQVPLVAVVRCSGSLLARERKSLYDGPKSCLIAHTLFRGETGCQYGCLWHGDCVTACKFGAMYSDEKTGLPVVIEEKCVACGACVKACPRGLIELRLKGLKDRRVFVSCRNKDKGNVAMKHCKVACIGCGKCVKVCPFDAIYMIDHLAFIDDKKCKLCRKCVAVCPTKAIIEVNFPPRSVEEADKKTGA